MSTSGGVQYIEIFNISQRIPITNLLSHMNQDVPPMYSWYPFDVLNTPQCTYDIPHMNHDIPPTYTEHPQCTEHPPIYLTRIIQGETIQILKPNANEQVILSTLTFVTGLLQASLF